MDRMKHSKPILSLILVMSSMAFTAQSETIEKSNSGTWSHG